MGRKQKTKKAEYYRGLYLCPKCGYIVGFKDDDGISHFCERCGQAITPIANKEEGAQK